MAMRAGATEIGIGLKKYAMKSASERRSLFLVHSIKRKKERKKRVNSDMKPMKYDISRGGYEIIALITLVGDSFTLACILPAMLTRSALHIT